MLPCLQQNSKHLSQTGRATMILLLGGLDVVSNQTGISTRKSPSDFHVKYVLGKANRTACRGTLKRMWEGEEPGDRVEGIGSWKQLQSTNRFYQRLRGNLRDGGCNSSER